MKLGGLHVLSSIDPDGHETLMVYDGKDNSTSSSALVGDNNVAQSWTYDAVGDVLTATDK